MARKTKNKEVLVKIICVLLSFGLWLYVNNIQNPTTTRVISNIPVEILNPQVLSEYNLALAPNQDITVNLTIEGPTSEVYRINKSQFRVVVDLVSYGLKAGDNSIPVDIMNSPTGVNIKNNFPRVDINLENLTKKSMSISSEINVKNSKGTYVKNVKVSPTTATVSGPQSLVDQVSKLVVKQEINNVEGQMIVNVPIVPVNAQGVQVSGLSVNPVNASAIINVEKGKSVPIKVATTGALPPGYTLKALTPSEAAIDIVSNDVNINDISSISTEPINLSTLTGNASIPINLIIPDGVINLSGSNSISVSAEVTKDAPETVSKTLELPIVLTGEQSDYNYALGKATASVTFKGLQADLDALDLNSLTCQADVSSLTANGTATLTVNGISNQNISVASITPAGVDVTVTAKENTNKPVEPPVTPPVKPEPTKEKTKTEKTDSKAVINDDKSKQANTEKNQQLAVTDKKIT